MKSLSDIKILFLAKYAPVKNIEYSIEKDYVEEHHKYHTELYNELKKHCCVIPSNNFEDIISKKEDIDFIFSVYNKANFNHSEIFPSVVAEYYHIPYLGAHPNARAVAEDKQLSKMVATYAQVPVPKGQVFSDGDFVEESQLLFEPPYFIKPRYGANSQYIDQESLQTSKEGAIKKINELLNENVDVILEEYINGIYYSMPVWKENNEYKFFKSIRQKSDNIGNIVTFEQKTHRSDGLSRSLDTDPKIQASLERYAKRIYELLEPLDFARFDFMVDEVKKEAYFIELNICCSLSERSSFAQSAESEGIDYANFIYRILLNSLRRHKLID